VENWGGVFWGGVFCIPVSKSDDIKGKIIGREGKKYPTLRQQLPVLEDCGRPNTPEGIIHFAGFAHTFGEKCCKTFLFSRIGTKRWRENSRAARSEEVVAKLRRISRKKSSKIGEAKLLSILGISMVLHPEL